MYINQAWRFTGEVETGRSEFQGHLHPELQETEKKTNKQASKQKAYEGKLQTMRDIYKFCATMRNIYKSMS